MVVQILYTMSGSIGGSANAAQWTTAGDGVFDNIPMQFTHLDPMISYLGMS